MSTIDSARTEKRGAGIFSSGSLFRVKEFGIFLALIGLFLVFSLSSPAFLTINNLMNVIRQVSILGIITIGMTMVIVSGEIDLSVGSVYGMCAMISGVLMTNGVPIWIATGFKIGPFDNQDGWSGVVGSTLWIKICLDYVISRQAHPFTIGRKKEAKEKK